jgi:hypothetical protein
MPAPGGQDAEDEEANEPVQVTGVYLTADYIPDLGDKAESEVSVGGRVEKDGSLVDLSQLTATGQLLDSVTNQVVRTITIDIGASDYHYKFNLPAATAKTVTLIVETKDAAGKSKKMSRSMADMGGSALTAMSADRVFDFESLQPALTGLTAANFCGASGPLAAVTRTVGSTPVTIATMKQPESEPMDKGSTCFRKVTDFMGSATNALLASSEKLGDFVGSGTANGGNLPCLFVFMEKTGDNPGPMLLYVLKDNKDGLDAKLQKTAFDLKCP